MKLKNTSNNKKHKKGKFMILDIDKENQNSINVLKSYLRLSTYKYGANKAIFKITFVFAFEKTILIY